MTTNIEWVRNIDGTRGYTINPVKGLCPVDCKDNQGKSYCYARRMYKRFKWNPEIRYDPNAFRGLPSKPARVFVGSTMELFGDWIDRDWMHMTFAKILARPQHTFIFLTKQPQNLPREFPENCWVGVTATGNIMFAAAYFHLVKVEARLKYISLEPLLTWDARATMPMLHQARQAGVDWLIIGQQTPVSAKTQPKISWISEIVEAADKAGIKVFLKDNLLELVNYQSPETDFAFNKEGCYRQELPK